MRCLSIADAAAEIGEECLFLSSKDTNGAVIAERGYSAIYLRSGFREMEVELSEMEAILYKHKPELLFIDSYAVTEKYLLEIAKICHRFGGRTTYIDDVLAFAYPCDTLVNYNIYGTKWQDRYVHAYRVAGQPLPRLLLGTNYVPLRKEFQEIPEREIRYNATQALISTGGADPKHIALCLLLELKRRNISNMGFHFLLGPLNQDSDEIKRIAKGMSNIWIHENIKDLKQLMQMVDVAVSAAGSTLYELCATQTPTIVYTFAENQIEGARTFAEYGIMEYLGDYREEGASFFKKLIERVCRLTDDYNRRAMASEAQRKLVSGDGAKQIILNLDYSRKMLKHKKNA